MGGALVQCRRNTNAVDYAPPLAASFRSRLAYLGSLANDMACASSRTRAQAHFRALLFTGELLSLRYDGNL
jgi:hypothetical protein